MGIFPLFIQKKRNHFKREKEKNPRSKYKFTKIKTHTQKKIEEIRDEREEKKLNNFKSFEAFFTFCAGKFHNAQLFVLKQEEKKGQLENMREMRIETYVEWQTIKKTKEIRIISLSHNKRSVNLKVIIYR